MGNREQLMAGARECLIEKGYLQTTARDIANASGVSLAAIGYHFGTKEALLQEALMESSAEWGQRVSKAAEEMRPPEGARWSECFEQVWDDMLSASDSDQRMLRATLEALMNVDQADHVCTRLENGMRCTEDAFLNVLEHKHDASDPEQAPAIGSFYLALMIGVHLLRVALPDRAPNARDLRLAMQTISRSFCEEEIVDASRGGDSPI